MMALIGFGSILIIGLLMLVAGIVAASITMSFSGRIEWPPVVIFCGIGGSLVYFALTHSPIMIVWGAK